MLLKGFLCLVGFWMYGDPGDGCPQFNLTVMVQTEGEKATSAQTHLVPSERKPSLVVLTVRKNQPLRVKWVVHNVHKLFEFSDVYVHFFAVEEEEIGQKNLPDLGRDVAHEGVMTMDFNPGEKAEGTFSLTLNKPGAYLIRAETLYMADSVHEHDHFAAIEVLVE